MKYDVGARFARLLARVPEERNVNNPGLRERSDTQPGGEEWRGATLAVALASANNEQRTTNNEQNEYIRLRGVFTFRQECIAR